MVETHDNVSVAVPDTPSKQTTAGYCRIELSDSFDVECLRASFDQKRRLFVSHVLRSDCAVRLHQHLAKERSWGLSLAAGFIGRRFASPAKYHQFTRSEIRNAFDVAYSDCGACGSHLFESVPLPAPNRQESGVEPYLAHLAEFLSSDAFVALVRQLTGMMDVRAVVASACRYRAGHFYASHVDTNGGKTHRVSFVLNLTRGWQAQWGGLLQFKGPTGDIEEAYVPRFNSLHLFSPTQAHAVSMVTPYARGARYSIGGALVA